MIYGIDADRLTVWIGPFDVVVASRAGVLCRRHADAMVVPLGWMLDDRRDAVPRLFKTRETPSPTRVRAKRTRIQRRDETGQLELPVLDEEIEETTRDVGRAPSSPSTPPWKPVFDHTDDLGGLLTAESPLLSRAFGRRERPPSS